MSKRKGEEKRRTQEGEDFDFFPLLTPLIETMKEGDTPSFKSPLRCAEKEAFSLRTSFLAGDCGLPLPGADEGRTQSPQPRRFARPSPLGEGRKRHSRQGGLAAAAPVSLRGDGRVRTPSHTGVKRRIALSGAATAAPAEMPFSGDNLSIPYDDRVDQRRGEVPSFVVSRMGSRGREIEIPSPGVLSLFVLLPLHGQRENGHRPSKGH